MTKDTKKQDNVRRVALDTLFKIEKEKSYSNILLNHVLEETNLNELDKGLLTELVYGTIQRKATIDQILTQFINLKKTDLWLLILLRISVYQILFLDRVPNHAVLNEAVEIAKMKSKGKMGSFVNGVLRNVLRKKDQLVSKDGDFISKLEFETSHPKWLIEYLDESFGQEEAAEICESNIEAPVQTLRVNHLKTTRAELIDLLKNEGFTVHEGHLSDDCLVNVKGNVAHSSVFERGYFTIQDESSMLVARALNPQKGERILDCCAAPGGKTTHIAERMENKGEIIATDLHKHKVKLIRKAANRLGLDCIQVQESDARKLPELFPNESFDRVLVDAPCSGLGVIRRKPEIKDSKTKDDVINLSKIQSEILAKVAPLVKKGGILTYSTCTIGPIENENVVESFLQENQEFELDSTLHDRMPNALTKSRKQAVGQIVVHPQDFMSDGFFIAVMRRKGM